MANTKLSEIADGGAVAGATDKIVTVRSGTTDLLTTPVALDLAQIWTAVQTFNNGNLSLLGSSTGHTLLESANAGASNYVATLPANTGTIAELNLAQTWTALQTFTNSDLAMLGSSTGKTTVTSDNSSATNYTQHLQAANGTIALTAVAPIAVGASLSASVGGTYLLNTAAGSVLTLPAMTGSGAVFEVIVTTAATSNAHKVLANSVSDFFIGNAIGQNGGTPLMFQSPAATNHSLQMPFAGTQPSGGLVGDRYFIKDIAANLAEVTGTFSAGTTPTTPFSAATS
jgi:hypothetical protein